MQTISRPEELKGSAMQDAARRAAEIGKELETVYARWEELEARR